MRSAIALARASVKSGRAAITATGVSAPAGSLDRWFVARNAASANLVEIALLGDSTMYGQTLSGPYYSPAQRVRERLIAAGYADGGHGNLNGLDDVTSTGESLTLTQGFASSNAFVLPGETSYSAVTGDNQTFTRSGRYLTLWYSRFNSAGRFTYEIDGSGVEVPVDPAFPIGTVVMFAHTAVIDMGSTGTHTIKIRNKGGRLVTAPNYTGSTGNVGSGTGGTLAAGTYDYAVAFAAPDGKIGPIGPTRTVTVSAGQTYSFGLSAQAESAGTTTNVYRRSSGVGAFKLIGSVATNSGSPYSFNDTGATAGIDYTQDAGPVLNSTMQYVNVASIVTKATGIVLHNITARGSGSGMAASDRNLAVSVGLDLDTNAAAIDRALDTTSGARHPVLVILTHGINDQQQNASDNSAAYGANTVTAIRAARRVGADVLVTLPCWETAAQQQNASLYRAAGKAAAAGEGAAWIDLGIGGALPSVVAGATTNPHLTTAQYQAQGDFIWDQLLGL